MCRLRIYIIKIYYFLKGKNREFTKSYIYIMTKFIIYRILHLGFENAVSYTKGELRSMYFISGIIFIASSLVMFFFIDLFSRVFSQEVTIYDEEVMQGYYHTGSLLFPLIAGLIGLFFIVLHFLMQGKTK